MRKMTEYQSSKTPKIVAMKNGVETRPENIGKSGNDKSLMPNTPATIAIIKVGEITEASIRPVKSIIAIH